jgi:hypothetical protein
MSFFCKMNAGEYGSSVRMQVSQLAQQLARAEAEGASISTDLRMHLPRLLERNAPELVASWRTHLVPRFRRPLAYNASDIGPLWAAAGSKIMAKESEFTAAVAAAGRPGGVDPLLMAARSYAHVLGAFVCFGEMDNALTTVAHADRAALVSRNAADVVQADVAAEYYIELAKHRDYPVCAGASDTADSRALWRLIHGYESPYSVTSNNANRFAGAVDASVKAALAPWVEKMHARGKAVADLHRDVKAVSAGSKARLLDANAAQRMGYKPEFKGCTDLAQLQAAVRNGTLVVQYKKESGSAAPDDEDTL